MIKYSFKTFLRYILMALAFALVSFFMSSCKVKASLINLDKEGQYVSWFYRGDKGSPNGQVGSKFSVVPGGYATLYIHLVTNDSTASFAYVDVCSSGDGPKPRVAPSNEKQIFPVETMYRVKGNCGNGRAAWRTFYYITNMSVYTGTLLDTAYYNQYYDAYGTMQLINVNAWNNEYEVIGFGVSNQIFLDDIIYYQNESAITVLNNILNELKNQASSNVTGAINVQTQKIEEQLKQQQVKQDATNSKLDSANSKLDSTNSKLDDANKKQDETNKKLDDMNNADISAQDKEQPDSSKYDDFKDTEDSLIDMTKQADMGSIDIGIDGNSSSFIWDTLTSFIQSHSAVFGMFIAILSIGIIKLALGR